MDVITIDPQYVAATEAVALVDRSERGKLAVSGPDAVAYLDSLLSNDIAAIAVGSGADATLLSHKGRMLAEVRVLAAEHELLLDTERVALQALFDALNQYGIGYRAQLHKRTLQSGLLSLIGPGADAPFATPPGPAEHDHLATELAGRPVRAIRTDLGIDVLCASEDTGAVATALHQAGAPAIDEGVAETVRVEHGRPRFGVELGEDTMPQEAGVHERAVSYTKGCYIGPGDGGPHSTGKAGPGRRLRGLRFSAPVPSGAALLLGERAGRHGSRRSSRRRGHRHDRGSPSCAGRPAGARSLERRRLDGGRHGRRAAVRFRLTALRAAAFARRSGATGGVGLYRGRIAVRADAATTSGELLYGFASGDGSRADLARRRRFPDEPASCTYRGTRPASAATPCRPRLERISPLALRYGATSYAVYRNHDDAYRLLQLLGFDEHLDWERWWNGPEMIDFRTFCQGWFQIPVLYTWSTLVCEGHVPSRAHAEAGNGH